MPPCILRKIIQKIEETIKLDLPSTRGQDKIPYFRRYLSLEAIRDFLHGNVSVCDVFHCTKSLNAYFTKLAVLRIFKPVHLLQDRDSKVRKTFVFLFVVRMMVDVDWSWHILWSDEAHFCLSG